MTRELAGGFDDFPADGPNPAMAISVRDLSTAVRLRDRAVRWALFEAVEDQVEAELVLVAIVVTGLQHVPERELGEVGILVGGEARPA